MRDKEKYVYLTIGILRDSLVHKMILQMAEELPTKHLPTALTVLLREYAQLKQRGFSLLPIQQNGRETPIPSEDPINDTLSNAADAANEWPE